MNKGTARARKGLVLTALLAVIAAGAMPAAAAANASSAKAKKHKKSKKHKPVATSNDVTLMTRNLYLGADLTPALAAGNVEAFSNANGQILNSVDATNFPARAVLLAAEIKGKNPDLVGLQEAAMWRIQDPPDPFSQKPATQVKYDFIASLLGELNKGAGPHYSLVYAQPEFDFEGPADLDNNNATGHTVAGGLLPGIEVDGRLTMRDAILVKDDAGVKVTNAFGGTFNSLLHVTVGGAVQVDVTRGYVQADVNARGSKFRLVDAHLEAFDSQPANPVSTGGTVGRGEIRQAQAKQLLSGPLQAKGMPSILIGDLNSNVPGVQPGDQLAFQSILDGGFSSRTQTPTSCCYSGDLLDNPADTLDHQVDQIVTNDPSIRMASSSIATTFANGLWSSDHAGVASTLSFPQQSAKPKHKKKKHKKHRRGKK